MPDTEPRKRNKTKANTHTQSAPLQTAGESVPALVERAEPEKTYHQPQPDQGEPKNRFGRWLYRHSQIILNVLTFGVLVIYGLLWYDARSTRELENRAYVGVKSVGMMPRTDTPLVGDVLVTFINTGRTPALNIQSAAKLVIRETPLPEDAGFDPPDATLPSKGVLGPNLEVINNAGPLPTSEADKMMQTAQPQPATTAPGTAKQPTASTTGVAQQTPASVTDKRQFYAYGEVTYDDIFSKPHKTRFCFYNVPGTKDWRACPTYNSFN